MNEEEIINYEKEHVTIRDNDWLDRFSKSLVLAERKRCAEIARNVKLEIPLKSDGSIVLGTGGEQIAAAIEGEKSWGEEEDKAYPV